MNKLGIVTDCIHMLNEKGSVCTENHILLKQLQALSKHFDEVHICCPFVAINNYQVVSEYTESHIHFIPVKNVGGDKILDKIKLIFNILNWFIAFKKLNNKCTIVYQRFPNNLNIPGFFYFHFTKKPVFATFTGTWDYYSNEPFTYRFQKKLLQQYFRGPVWAYLSEPSNSKRILNGFSPSYSSKVWNNLSDSISLKINQLQEISTNIFCIKIITVGALVANKNQQFILDTCLLLFENQIPFNLIIVGDGNLKNDYQEFINNNNLQNCICLAGKKTAEELSYIYKQQHIVVQAPIQEGFGKVPIEGFFHGVVPVISEVPVANAMINNGKRGYIFQQNNKQQLFEIIKSIQQNPKHLIEKIKEGRQYASTQTLESWAKDYKDTVVDFYRKNK
jgi:glycosyltransferase involved in cell wall biosynthesis